MNSPLDNIKTLLAMFDISKKDIQALAILANKGGNQALNLKLINLLNAYSRTEHQKVSKLGEDLSDLLKFFDTDTEGG